MNEMAKENLVNQLAKESIATQRDTISRHQLLGVHPRVYYEIEEGDLRSEFDKNYYLSFGRLPWDHPKDLEWSRNSFLMAKAAKECLEVIFG